MLAFKSDFCQMLENHGRLPATNLKTKLNTSTTLDRIKTKMKITKDIAQMDENELSKYITRTLNFRLKQTMTKNFSFVSENHKEE